MQADGNAKQLVVERVKNATNILVTVSRNPSVDALSAAIGLTLMLNKLDKHATAVFSGSIPSAIEFLQPEKTFENTVDSLRDFIIALDKEKADRLRYKVEDDVVRIFITPYRTIINENDLKFSQGDFNVDLIIALDVDNKEDLDTAITAHGRILHDAALVTINANNDKNTLDGIDWSDEKASSLCEMLMSLSEALQSGILDEQISTALLTGIVAATERFRNTNTSPKVMTMAAQLMAAGANQQLIAAKLEEGHELPVTPVETTQPDGSTKLTEGASEKLSKTESSKLAPAAEEKTPADGEMQISHDEVKSDAPATPEAELDDAISKTLPVTPTLSVDDLKKDIAAATDELSAAAEQSAESSAKPKHEYVRPDDSDEPTFTATFNATTEAAAEEKRDREQQNRQHSLLSHDTPESDVVTPPAPEIEQKAPDVEPVSTAESHPPKADPSTMTLAELDAQARGSEPSPSAKKSSKDTAPVTDNSLDEARAAVDAAIQSQFDPAHNPTEALNAQPLEFIETPVPGSQPTPPQATTSPAPTMPVGLPPLPDFSTLPPLPGEQQPPIVTPTSDSTAPTSMPTAFGAADNMDLPPSEPQSPPPADDPTQFKLPGQ